MNLYFYAYVLMMVLFVESMKQSYSAFFEKRFNSNLFQIFIVIMNIVFVAFIFGDTSSFVRSVLLIVLFFMNFMMQFKTTVLISFSISMIHIVAAYAIRGMVFPLIALLKNQSLTEAMTHKNTYYLIQCLCVFMTILLLKLFRKYLINENDFNVFIRHPFQLRTYSGWLFTSWVLMMVINTGRYRNIDPVWYSTTYFTTSLLISISFVYFYYYLNKITVYSEKETLERQIIESLESKLELYKRLEDQLMSIRKFRHDYRKVLHSLKIYADNNDSEGMSSFINQTLEVVDVPIDAGMEYSNHFLLDAMLQDIAIKAEKNNVDFDAKIFFPDSFEMTDLDVVRLFGNLIENSLSHAMHGEHGWIKIQGKESNRWFHFSISNSFDGVIKKSKGKIISRKIETEDHGHGLVIIQDIVKRLNGVITYSDNESHDVFTVKISIPLI